MILLAFAGAVGASALGAATARASIPGGRGGWSWFRTCVGCGVGLAAWSLGPLVSLLGGPTLEWALAAALLVAAALLWRFGGASPSAGPALAFKPAPMWFAACCAGALALVIACAIEHSVRWPDGGWDAWAIWNLHARAILRGGRDAFPAQHWQNHPDYPLLLPSLAVQGWRIAGESRLWPALLGGAFAALQWIALGSCATALRGSRAGLLAGLMLLSTPLFLWAAHAQYADGPLGFFVLLAAGLLATHAEGYAPRAIPLAGACAAAAAWTKNEGLLHFCALAAALLAIRIEPTWRQHLSKALRFLAGGLPLLVALVAFKVALAPATDLATELRGADVVSRLFSGARWGGVAFALIHELVRFDDWGFSLPAATVAAAIWFWRGRPARAARLLLASAALVLGGFAFVYVLASRDLAWHLPSSLPRLLWQLFPSLCLGLSLGLWPRGEELALAGREGIAGARATSSRMRAQPGPRRWRRPPTGSVP